MFVQTFPFECGGKMETHVFFRKFAFQTTQSIEQIVRNKCRFSSNADQFGNTRKHADLQFSIVFNHQLRQTMNIVTYFQVADGFLGSYSRHDVSLFSLFILTVFEQLFK